jgi:CheY-like chemotaxis protein
MARVIVADDAAPVRKLISVVLLRRGHEVLEAPTGRGAIEAIERGDCEVVVLDLMMPEVSGYEVLEYLRRNRPQALRCVIVVTAMADAEFDERIGLRPPFRLLKKPFDLNELVLAVESCAADRAINGGGEDSAVSSPPWRPSSSRG